MKHGSLALTPLSRLFSIPRPLDDSLAPFLSLHLALANNALMEGRIYTFVLTAFTSFTSSVSSSISVAVNTAPRFGEFTVTPSEGVGLKDLFFFACNNWQDGEQDLPLSFAFGFFSSSDALLPLRDRQESSSASSVLFPGTASSNYTVTCNARVFDAFSAKCVDSQRGGGHRNQ